MPEATRRWPVWRYRLVPRILAALGPTPPKAAVPEPSISSLQASSGPAARRPGSDCAGKGRAKVRTQTESMPDGPAHPTQASNHRAAASEQPPAPKLAAAAGDGALFTRSSISEEANHLRSRPSKQARAAPVMHSAEGTQQAGRHTQEATAKNARCPAEGHAAVVAVSPGLPALDVPGHRLLWGQKRERSRRKRQQSPAAKVGQVAGFTGSQTSGPTAEPDGMQNLSNTTAPLVEGRSAAGVQGCSCFPGVAESTEMQSHVALSNPVKLAGSTSCNATAASQVSICNHADPRQSQPAGSRQEDANFLAPTAPAIGLSQCQKSPVEAAPQQFAVSNEDQHRTGLTKGRGKENWAAPAGCRSSTRVRKASTKYTEVSNSR